MFIICYAVLCQTWLYIDIIISLKSHMVKGKQHAGLHFDIIADIAGIQF